MAKKRNENICISCLGEFPDKESYWVLKNGAYHVYCMDCIMEKAITEYKCIAKPRKKKNG